MSNIAEFFHTDWQAMTGMDWTGILAVLILSTLMAGLYIWIFKPTNKSGFEQHANFVNSDQDDASREVAHGQAR